jgi:PAS domain S-box-containing protein
MKNSGNKNKLTDPLPQNTAVQDIKKPFIDYKAIFEYSIDAFVIFSENFGQVIEINDAASNLLGYSREELLNMRGRDLLFTDEYERLKKIYEKNMLEFDAITTEIELKTKSRKKIPVSVSVRKILNGEHIQYLMIARDISYVKHTEDALRREAFIFENLHDGVIIIDLDGYIQSWNKAAGLIFGYSRNEIINSYIEILFDKQGFNWLFGNIKQKSTQNKYATGEICFIKKDGKEGFAETSVFPFRDSSGEHIANVVIVKDITQRKITERSIRERDLMYRALIESSSDAIYVLKGRRLLMVNSAWCDLFGYSREEATSEKFDVMRIVAPESKDFILKRFSENIVYEGRYSNYEMRGITKDNRSIDLDVRVNKILWKGETVFQGIYRDITEKKKAEREIKESEEKFRKLAEKSLVGIYIIQDGIFKYINPKLAEIFGYNTEEIIDRKGPGDLTYPDDRKVVSDNIAARLSGGVESIAYSFRGIKKDGTVIYVDVYGSATMMSGKPAVIGTLMDITERNRAEEALRESEKKYRTIIESASDAIVIVDIESGKIIDVNKKAEKLTGHSRKELIGQSHLYLHPDEYRKEYAKVFAEAVSQKQQISPIDILVITKAGEIIPVEINSGKYVLGGREVIQGIFRDLRERKKIEGEIRKLSRAVEQSPSAIIITDTNGTIEYVNPYFCSVTGYSAEEVIGRNPSILKSGETSVEEYKRLWDTISSGKEWHGEFHNKKKNGELYWEQASISPIRDEEGYITHYIAIKEDITDKKWMQQELLIAKEKAEESARMKSEFLSQMSHEIRTPLNVILSYNSFLQDELSGTINEDIRLSFNSIDSAGKRLMRTIDMILNLSAIQKGILDINLNPVDVGEILKSLAKEFEFQAREKNLYLKLNLPDSKICVQGDEYVITEIFQNLLNNAIKFTVSGGVEVSLSVLTDKKVKVDVKDTGIGISENYIPGLFMPFTQEETGYTRKFEGNGLGLALVKNYIDLLKSEIKIKSEKGKGTVFSVIFNSDN